MRRTLFMLAAALSAGLWESGLVFMWNAVNPGLLMDLALAALCLQPMLLLRWARRRQPPGRLVAFAFTALLPFAILPMNGTVCPVTKTVCGAEWIALLAMAGNRIASAGNQDGSRRA